MLREGRSERAIHRLATILSETRDARTRSTWERWLIEEFERSSLCDHMFPELTRLRRLADLVYLGGNIALVDAFTRGGTSAQSVAFSKLPFARSWAQRPARYAEELTSLGRGRVVVVGCGHLSEIAAVPGVRSGSLAITAYDSDIVTIEHEARELARSSVALRYVSLQQLLLFGASPPARACLVPYALDHHRDELIVRLLRRALLLVAPGGVVIGSNLAADAGAGAFVEATATARLRCRSQRAIRGLAEALPASLCGDVAIRRDETGASWTLRIVRR